MVIIVEGWLTALPGNRIGELLFLSLLVVTNSSFASPQCGASSPDKFLEVAIYTYSLYNYL